MRKVYQKRAGSANLYAANTIIPGRKTQVNVALNTLSVPVSPVPPERAHGSDFYGLNFRQILFFFSRRQ